MYIHTYFEEHPHEESGGYHLASFHSLALKSPRKVANTLAELKNWCYMTYGPDGWRHNTQQVRWRDNIANGEIRFSREDDLALFLLRWS